MPLLTVYTPTYNRKHTIIRTFESLLRQTCRDFCWLIIDDGSTDNTREWVLSLISDERLKIKDSRFDWMGRLVESRNAEFCKSVDPNSHFVIEVPYPNGKGKLQIEYIYKPNGGLYTGYNVAFATIETELCVCIDSDDFMPEDAVEKISKKWKEYYPQGSLISKVSPLTNTEYCGIEGLDFDIRTNEPIGGYFPKDLKECFMHEIGLNNYHHGDTKQVMRTELMRKVVPQIGFEGEKNFNPIYLLLQVCDKYPLIILNDNLCTVEYQIGADSMSQGIYRQYVNSPCSFAKMRLQEMTLVHNTQKDRFRSAIHYVSSCIIAKDKDWLKKSPKKFLTLCAAPFGVLVCCLIKYKAR